MRAWKKLLLIVKYMAQSENDTDSPTERKKETIFNDAKIKNKVGN